MTQTPSTPQTPQQTTQGVVGQAQDKVGQMASQAQDTAGQVAGQAKQQATSQLESQKGRAVDSLVTVAQALRQTGQHLHEQEQGPVGGYVEQAAERVEHVTNYLRTRDVPQLVAETQDFARRQPGVFLAGAVALGFIGARFLMSSGQRAATQRVATSGSPYPPTFGQSGMFEASGYASRTTPNPGGVHPARGTASALEA